MDLKYGYSTGFHVRSISAGIVLALAAYYAIIAFHRVELIGWFGGLNLPTVMALLVLPLATKIALSLRVFRSQKSSKKALGAFFLTSFYLVMTALAISAPVAFGHWLASRGTKAYLVRSHWFWVTLLLAVSFGYAYLGLNSLRLICWRLLQDLKALPFLSPIFCFGGPYLWANNLAYASLPKNLLSAYNSLTMLAGSFFLLYLIYFASLNQRFDPEATAQPGQYVMAEGSRLRENSAATIGLIIFSSGLYIFLVVVSDIVLQLVVRL